MTGNEYSTGWLAEHVGGELRGPTALAIRGINNLEEATADEITLITNAGYARRWVESQAGAALISEGIEPQGHDPEQRALIVVRDASVAAADLLDLFTPPALLPDPGVHPTAWVHPDAKLGADVRIGPHVSVDAGAALGDRVMLFAGTRIYPHVTVGEDTVIHANCVIRERCTIGRRVIMHPGVCIGADGFGYVPAAGTGLRKISHIGTVEIHDDVELGANTCIDRGKFGPTIVGEGTKIDNMVQVGHNCRIGRHTSISGLCGFAGSCEIGDGVILGGNVGLKDHVKVGDGAIVGAKSGLMHDVKPGQRVVGYPAYEVGETLRQVIALRKLPALLRKLERQQDAG